MMNVNECFSQQVDDQNPILIKEGSQFLYDGNTYKMNELSFIFQNDPALMSQYNQAIKFNKRGKVFGYTTLGVFGVGALSLAIDPSDAAQCDNCWSEGILIAAVSVLVIPVTGSIALLSHFKGKGKMNKLVTSFNEKQYDALGRVIELPQLNMSTSGLGIVISF